ncbi:hypothetical protein M153_8924000549 [Pseudoloma neurophilia]|uniref:Uncharacterized protein n=1 Tax=Pseudoloma neurophilia TaxID=146866 RepID=A0A0R0LRY6_9MICR|nr:hypothetical protein M153_8924000549 [Pseudoloma neurophilia]
MTQKLNFTTYGDRVTYGGNRSDGTSDGDRVTYGTSDGGRTTYGTSDGDRTSDGGRTTSLSLNGKTTSLSLDGKTTSLSLDAKTVLHYDIILLTLNYTDNLKDILPCISSDAQKIFMKRLLQVKEGDNQDVIGQCLAYLKKR